MSNLTEKEKWIIEYIESNKELTVDIFNEKFVEDYIKTFNVKHTIQPYGAPTCRDLGKVLSQMYKNNMLQRYRHVVSGMSGMGFPKWFYSYYIK